MTFMLVRNGDIVEFYFCILFFFSSYLGMTVVCKILNNNNVLTLCVDRIVLVHVMCIAYVADWKVFLEKGAPHEVKDHSVEVS